MQQDAREQIFTAAAGDDWRSAVDGLRFRLSELWARLPESDREEFLARPDRAANILAPVEEQCRWLQEIGFQHVDCFWKYFELAILGGIK